MRRLDTSSRRPSRPQLRRAVLVLASASLTTLSLNPGACWFALVFIALAPLVVALRAVSARAAIAWAWLFGCVVELSVAYWLPATLARLFGASKPMAVAGWVAFGLWDGARFALFGGMFAGLRKLHLNEGVALVSAFCVSEILWPGIVPWPLGMALLKLPALVQCADFGGASFVTGLALSVNAACLACTAGRGAKARLLSTARWLTLPILAGVYGCFALGKFHRPDLDAAREKLIVGVVQGNAGLNSSSEERIRRYVEMSRRVSARVQLDVIVWTETVVSVALPEKIAPAWVKEHVTSGIGVPIILGATLEDASTKDLYNSALVSDRHGVISQRYDKQRLVPFVEKVPKLARDLRVEGLGNFIAGKKSGVVTLGGVRVAVVICYDMLDADYLQRRLREEPVGLIVQLTNDGWFGDSIAPALDLGIARMRAIEHRRFVVRGADSGPSAILEPTGEISAIGPMFEAGVLIDTVPVLEERTLFDWWGNLPVWLIATAGIVRSDRWRRARQNLAPLVGHAG